MTKEFILNYLRAQKPYLEKEFDVKKNRTFWQLR